MAAPCPIHVGRLLRVSLLPWLILGAVIFGGFYASVSLFPVNNALAVRRALHDPACKYEKTVSIFRLRSEQPSLTIFTAPTKPFSPSPHDPQYKAVLSWLSLEPTPKIVLLGNDPSFYEVSQKLRGKEVSVEPNVDYNLWGTPQVHSIFARAQHADTNISMIVSTHTLFFPDLMEALHKTHQDHRSWILFGKSQEMELEDLSTSFTSTGARHNPTKCKDQSADTAISQGSLQGQVTNYWAWSNDHSEKKPSSKPLLMTPIPPFSYVLGTFEEWILQHLLKEAVPSRVIIDASEVVTSARMTLISSTPSSEREEAHINGMLFMNSNGDPQSTSEAPWKLVRCVQPNTNHLCLLDQRREEESTSNRDHTHGAQLAPHRDSKQFSVLGRLKESEARTLDALLPQVADENKVVVMVGGTSNYKEMLLSFICRARSLGIQNLLIAAFDETLYEYAYLQGLPVYLEHPSEQYKPAISSDGRCDFESECFKHVSKLKSMSVLRVLKKGYSVLWSDMDIAWFDNPLPQLVAFGPNTLPIQSDEPNPDQPENGILHANSGFYLARAEEKTIRAFEAIVKHATKSSTTEQPSFYIIMCGKKGERRVGDRECMGEEGGLRTIFLSHEQYPNGKVYGHWASPDAFKSCQQKGCVLLHNNHIVGKDKKVMRFVAHGLWFYDVKNRMCMQPWHSMKSKHLSSSEFRALVSADLNITSPQVKP